MICTKKVKHFWVHFISLSFFIKDSLSLRKDSAQRRHA